MSQRSFLSDGIRYERGGVVHRAREAFETVARHADDDPASAAEALWRLANLHRLHSSWEAALDSAHRSAALAEAHGLYDTQANALNIEGAIWMMQGEKERARECYERTIALATTPATRAKGLQNLGGLAAEFGDLDEGERYFTMSREEYRIAGDPRGEANSLVNIGRLQSDRGDHAGARKTLEAAASGARAAGDLEMHAAALLNLGIALGGLGKVADAEERITTAYGQFTIADIPAQRVRCLIELAALSTDRDEAAGARICLEHARTVATMARLPRELRRIEDQLASLEPLA